MIGTSGVFETVATAYRQMLVDLLEVGSQSSPRSKTTYELTQSTFTILNPTLRCIVSQERALNPMFLIAELLWILRGDNRPEPLSRYVKAFEKFSDVNEQTGKRYMHGAYGTRLRNAFLSDSERAITIANVDQIKYVIETLTQDRDSRQAVMSIYGPQDTVYIGESRPKDIPCNTQLMWLLRDDRLNLFVIVRSQDAILGFPYDFYHWATLQEVLASILGAEVGSISYAVNSLHLYKKDWDWARRIVESPITGLRHARLFVDSLEHLDSVVSQLSSVEDHLFSADPSKTVETRFDEALQLADGVPLPWLQLLYPFFCRLVSDLDHEEKKRLATQYPFDFSLATMYKMWKDKHAKSSQ